LQKAVALASHNLRILSGQSLSQQQFSSQEFLDKSHKQKSAEGSIFIRK